MLLPVPAELTGAVGGPTTQQLPQRAGDAAQVCRAALQGPNACMTVLLLLM